MLVPKVVSECEHLLALAKPFGMPSQPDPTGDPSLLDWATEYLGHPPHLVHRLDRPTGGLNLLAKTPFAAAELSRQFECREIKKVYLAVVSGLVNDTPYELAHFIAKLPGKNFVRAYDKPVRRSKKAHLTAQLLKRSEGFSLLEVHPTTGRRHQIRAQLSRLKLSILGDYKYGKKVSALPYPGIALWAYSLTYSLDTTTTLTTPPPDLYPWNCFP